MLMQTSVMRTTIALDEDVHHLATYYAASRGITLSAAINEVVRAFGEGSHTISSPLKTLPNGLIVASARGKTITSEMVKAALEDDRD
jgi:hypothetical protein